MGKRPGLNSGFKSWQNRAQRPGIMWALGHHWGGFGRAQRCFVVLNISPGPLGPSIITLLMGLAHLNWVCISDPLGFWSLLGKAPNSKELGDWKCDIFNLHIFCNLRKLCFITLNGIISASLTQFSSSHWVLNVHLTRNTFLILKHDSVTWFPENQIFLAF